MSDGCIHKLFLAVLISINLLPGDAQTSVPNMNCNISNCVYCPNTAICQRCTENRKLINNGEACVIDCPDGFSESITRINGTDMFAAVCIGQGNEGDDSSGIPGVYIGIIVGVSAIVIIIFVVMVLYCLYAFKRGKTQRILEITDENLNGEMVSHQNEAFLESDADGQLSENTEDEDEDYTALADGDGEMAQFLRKLARLKKQSSIFLRMLNDMRRRLKELPQDATAAKSYKNVMQDVTRLLYLLNKKPQNIQMPPDGMQLLNWSEEILKRYLQSQQQRTDHARISTYGQQAETHF